MVTDVTVDTVPPVTVNVAVVAPCATVTLAGIVSPAGELDKLTVAPPDPAGLLSVTVPVAEPPLAIELGATARLDKAATGGFTITPNVSFTPRYEAVSVAEVTAVTVPAVTAKVVELDPWPIETCDGTCAAPLEDDIAMTAPPLPAAEVSETVHVELTVGLIVTGMQVNPFNPGAC